jgi:HEAT repeat protein
MAQPWISAISRKRRGGVKMGILGGLFRPNVERMEKKRDVEGLIDALKQGNADIRRKAASSLGRIGDARAVQPLIKALDDKDFYVRGDAAKALGEIGDKRAVTPLKRAMESEHIAIGGFSDFGDLARQAADMKRQYEYFKEAAAKALEKVKAKKT